METTKRIYNEYGAADNDNTKPIDQAITQLIDVVWKWREENNICPRDLNQYVINEINSHFTYHILSRAMKMRKSKQNN